MIELAQTVATLLQPFSVPLMVVIAYGVWKLDRRVLSLEVQFKEKSNV